MMGVRGVILASLGISYRFGRAAFTRPKPATFFEKDFFNA